MLASCLDLPSGVVRFVLQALKIADESGLVAAAPLPSRQMRSCAGKMIFMNVILHDQFPGDNAVKPAIIDIRRHD
jgi:hypothetical protein